MPQAASLKRASPLWFTPICDELYVKIAMWDHAYWYGEIHSTCKFLDTDGQQIDKPTRCAHKIPFRELELDHLLKIFKALRPESVLLEELSEIKKIWRYGKPVQGYRYMQSFWSKVNLPLGLHRIVTLAFYPEHVKEILAVLIEAKTGQKLEAAKRPGKDLFEE